LLTDMLTNLRTPDGGYPETRTHPDFRLGKEGI
jgi:hypothetical protein